MIEYTPVFAERFWSKVGDTTEGCWVWQASKDTRGYGHVWFDGQLFRAHRVAWELTNGPIPEGLVVLHECDFRPCVNPKHLRLGTQRDNIHDAIAKGRNVTLPGTKNGRAQLTEDQVREIRRRHAAGECVRTFAQEYGVAESTVYHVTQQISWKHLD